MSSLHLVYSSAGHSRVANLISSGDEMVLLGDGVYIEDDVAFTLAEDVAARGIDRANRIDYAELVKLTIEHEKVVSWT